MSRAKAIINGYSPPSPPTVLQNAGTRGEPAVRVAEDERPVYVDASMSFRSGWFGGGGGGLLGGLMIGSMLGGFGGWIVHESNDGHWSDGQDEYGD